MNVSASLNGYVSILLYRLTICMTSAGQSRRNEKHARLNPRLVDVFVMFCFPHSVGFEFFPETLVRAFPVVRAFLVFPLINV